MTSLIDKLLKWVLGVALLAVASLLVVKLLQLANEQAAHEKTKADHATEKAAAERARSEQLVEFRRLENRRWGVAQETARENLEQIARLERAAAGHRRDADQLRNAIAAYAAGTGGTAEDPAATCAARAAALGDLLGESLRVQVELAGAAERHLADARSLYTERASLADEVNAEGAP